MVRDRRWPKPGVDRRAARNCRRSGTCLRKGGLNVLGYLVLRAKYAWVVRYQFIEVWREKESALQAKKLTNLLLSNASHEGRWKNSNIFLRDLIHILRIVRTPLNHIIK